MSLVTRHGTGTVPIPAALLWELWYALDMDYDATAERDVVVALMAQHRDRVDNGGVEIDVESVHEWLTVGEVDALYRLRGWHRQRHGTIVVDTAALCDVRNVLELLLVNGDGMGCADLAAELAQAPSCADEHAIVAAAVAVDVLCHRCQSCGWRLLADRIDVHLDAAGVSQPAYYTPPDCDPEAIWREIHR